MLTARHIRQAADTALAEAERGVRLGHGGPFGAVVLAPNGRLLAKAHNTVIRDADPTAHAEVNAIRAATKRRRQPHLRDCVLVTTSEPCPLCLAAAAWAEIRVIRFIAPRGLAADFGFADTHLLQKRALSRPRRVSGAKTTDVRRLFLKWRALGGERY